MKPTTKLTAIEQVKVVYESVKRQFTSDGCTAVPDFNFGKDCCAQHDRDYYDHTVSRAEADARLRRCIQDKGYIILPWIYWLGVRIFGKKFYNK